MGGGSREASVFVARKVKRGLWWWQQGGNWIIREVACSGLWQVGGGCKDKALHVKMLFEDTELINLAV